MDKNEFSYDITVSENDIDDLAHVNNLIYLKWVLEAAENHWDHLTKGVFSERYAWVVMKHEIEYFKGASLNDELNISTWIGESYAVKSERFVQIKKANIVLAECKTIWCLIDRKTMRPHRIPESIINILNPADQH